MKNILEKIIFYLFKFLGRIDKHGNFCFTAACMGYEASSDYYVNYLIRHKRPAELIQKESLFPRDYSDYGIIIQGLIGEKGDFVYETIKLYSLLFPKARIIVSTWSKTKADIIETIEKLGAYVVINKEFDNGGYGNVNFQICTTLAGLKKSEELGCIYSLKTRTDFRIYKKYSLDYLSDILNNNPVVRNEVPLNRRIITIGKGRCQPFIPYWLKDFIYFGETGDLLNLFSIPYDTGERRLTLKELQKSKDDKDLFLCNPAETYITREFLKKYATVNLDVKSFWEVLKKYFYVISAEDLNVLWYKYKRGHEISLKRVSTERDYDDSKLDMDHVIFSNIVNESFKYSEELEFLTK